MAGLLAGERLAGALLLRRWVPQGLAALHNVVVSLLRRYHAPNLAATQRDNAWNGSEAVLRLLGLNSE